MRKLFSQYIGGIVFVIFLLPGAVFAESARSLVESGNEAFHQGDFAASLKNYEKAAESEPDSAIVLFNKGDALYKQGKFAEAINIFEQAAAKALENKDQALEAQSRYNMGNSAFRRAEELRRENPQMALEEYKRSSGYYQSAVKLKPNFSESAHNLEVSRMAAKQIEDFIRQQQQQAQEQAQQKQNLAEELEGLQKEQQGAAEQSRDLSQSQKQQDADNDAAQQAENQKAITDRTKETGEKLGQLGQGRNSQLSDEMAREHVKKAVQKQQEAEKNLRQNKPEAAHDNQQDAARELKKALQQLVEGSGEEQKNENSGQEQESHQPGTEQHVPQSSGEETGETGNPAQPVAESLSGDSPEDIINEEIENREYRSVRGGTGYKPVDRDW